MPFQSSCGIDWEAEGETSSRSDGNPQDRKRTVGGDLAFADAFSSHAEVEAFGVRVGFHQLHGGFGRAHVGDRATGRGFEALAEEELGDSQVVGCADIDHVGGRVEVADVVGESRVETMTSPAVVGQFAVPAAQPR